MDRQTQEKKFTNTGVSPTGPNSPGNGMRKSLLKQNNLTVPQASRVLEGWCGSGDRGDPCSFYVLQVRGECDTRSLLETWLFGFC